MAQSESEKDLYAPQLRLRRLAKVYFFPWVQIASLGLLSIYGWRIRVPINWLIGYGIIICLICVVEDLTAAQSRVMRILCLGKNLLNRLRKYTPSRMDLFQETQVYFTCRPPLFFAQRHTVRWWSSLSAILFTWGYALIQTWLFPANDLLTQLAFTLSLFLSALMPFMMLVNTPAHHRINTHKRLFFYSLGALGMLIGLLSFWRITTDSRIILFSVAFIAIHYVTTYVAQRLWAGQEILGFIVRQIGKDFLNWPDASARLQYVPSLIGSRLGYDRVFILEVTPNLQGLRIMAEYGDYQSVLQKIVPIQQSLTGRAFQTKGAVIWNNVQACPYYHSITSDDDTRAEIAVPILHRGTVYGILDVQTKVKGAYGPGDVVSLATAAQILGAAIAVEKREQFFQKATELWEEVITTNAHLASEHDVFELFAGFAKERLDADLVVYFPLSLAGFPVQFPYISGDLKEPHLLDPPGDDPQSSLVQLIAQWQPYFEPNVTEQAQVARIPTTSVKRSFVEREGIKSTCFLPVGTQQERLGVLFLNFRHHKAFDDTFKFTVYSLVQSLGQITAQVRYRNMVYKSFGRPEMNVHSIIGRRGFKHGVINQLRRMRVRCGADCCDDISECELFPLYNDMEEFIAEIRLLGSSHPPDFWEASLQEQLQRFKSALPDHEDGRRPRLRLNIDPLIEREYPLLKLALYRVITESISNAIVHGSASQIGVTIERGNHEINLTVLNNGRPLLEKAAARQSKNGIYTLLQECESRLGAKAEIKNQEQEQGVIVQVKIPVLPLTHIRTDDDYPFPG